MHTAYRTRRIPGSRAQAIVEFAIVLPMLLMLLVGILEVGRMIFIYAAVTNASREAVRYASAVGIDTDPDDGNHYQKYSYCKGILNTAKRSAYFIDFSKPGNTINISYDRNLTSIVVPNCDALSGEDGDVESNVEAGDRVVVTVTAVYGPLLKLIPIPPKSITSSSARTIIGVFDLESGLGSVPSGGGGGGGSGTGGGGGSSNTPTATATATTTATATPTATSTSIGPYTTPVFNTATATSFYTPTHTATPTATFTPTATSTPMPGCDSLEATSINVSGSTMRITIRNPHEAITVSDIQVTWNHDLGGGGKNPSLTLQSIMVGVETWTVLASGPSATIIPVPEMVISGNNTVSTISFAFNKGYQNLDGTESALVNFSTTGCAAIQMPKPTSTPTSVPTSTLVPTVTP